MNKLLAKSLTFKKSSIIFSFNTNDQSRDTICSLLGVSGHSGVEDHGHYMGLSLVIGRNKKEVFSYIRDRVR